MSTYEIKRGFPELRGAELYVEPSQTGSFMLIGYSMIALFFLIFSLWTMIAWGPSIKSNSMIIICSVFVLLVSWLLHKLLFRKPVRLIRGIDGEVGVMGLAKSYQLEQCKPEIHIQECRLLDVSRFSMKIRHEFRVKSLWLCLTLRNNKQRFCLLAVDIENDDSIVSSWQSTLGDVAIGTHEKLPYKTISIIS